MICSSVNRVVFISAILQNLRTYCHYLGTAGQGQVNDANEVARDCLECIHVSTKLSIQPKHVRLLPVILQLKRSKLRDLSMITVHLVRQGFQILLESEHIFGLEVQDESEQPAARALRGALALPVRKRHQEVPIRRVLSQLQGKPPNVAVSGPVAWQ